MSLAEKLHLLDGDTPFWAGMVDIATRDASHRHPWPTGCLPRLGLKGLQFVDGPRGVVLEGGATTFPVPIARGATWDPELEERIGEAIAREARSFGADWVAGVCVNLLRHPGWGRAQETYGEDPVHLGAMGAAMTRGLQRHTIACVKHFALNSIDSSRFLVDVRASQRVLHELYLPHFRDCVKAGAGSVMSAYNRVNGEWCGQHPQLLKDILKTRWDFGGFVVTDFIFGVREGVRALLAGQDLEMPFRMIFEGSLSEAVADGRLPIQRIDEAVLRLLQAQLTVPPGSYPMSLRHCADHRQLTREAATKSIVLLKNEGSVLPLRGLRSLAVIGPYLAVVNLGDRGSSDTRPEPGSVVTPLAGLEAAAPELRLEVADGADPEAAAALAAECDAALLVLGLDWRLEGEHIHPGDIAPILQQIPPPDGLLRLGRSRVLPLWRPVARLIAWITSYGSARRGGDFAAGDRTGLDLPPEQVALIEAVAAANPRTVVVLMGGGAILTEGWHDRVPGLLLLWYPGQQGGEALADVLLGRVSPSGRLPFTVPTDAAHLPPFEPRAQQVTYDLWHGYRRLRREGHRAAYPFGYGLSYSRFELADLTAAIEPQAGEEGELVVEVTVRNGGAMEADEVVQVYLEPPGRQVERPARVLVGFQRASLAMAEQRRLVLRIPLRRLAYFEESSDGFVLEPGLHRLVVARHVEDAGLALELQVEGRFLGR
ncbi:glycoside hydrolase family 3 C-terminal domain-containing protein [Synechococcus sp. CBW1006]|nr:glycoside hydrolase family 3 C-terminal domain-containing protein [Synechococcus sp. CBW1006]